MVNFDVRIESVANTESVQPINAEQATLGAKGGRAKNPPNA